jgi:hypothetical protein
LESLATLTE